MSFILRKLRIEVLMSAIIPHNSQSDLCALKIGLTHPDAKRVEGENAFGTPFSRQATYIYISPKI